MYIVCFIVLFLLDYIYIYVYINIIINLFRKYDIVKTFDEGDRISMFLILLIAI